MGLAPTRPTPTSVVADIGSGDGPLIAVRADIDALPIQEESDVEFRSKTDGMMHACGHDGHAAVALGVAAALTGGWLEASPRVRLIFQHSEERRPNGADQLIAANVLDGVSSIVAEHLWAPWPVGRIGISPGPILASADYFTVEFHGAAGHPGLPATTVDPIRAAAAFVQLVTSLRSELDAFAPAVATVTQIHAGTDMKVVPEDALVTGTLRTFAPSVRKRLHARVEDGAEATARSYGLSSTCAFLAGAPPCINDARVAEVLARVARDCVTPSDVLPMPQIMGADDFASYLERVPGAYVFIGAGASPNGGPYPHHHSKFRIEEDALRIASEVLLAGVLELSSQPPS